MSSGIVYEVVKTINAPLSFVYDWCTDFREDDPKLTGSTSKMKIIEKTDKRAVYSREDIKDGITLQTKSVVTMVPPDRWYLEAKGDVADYTGEYRLFQDGDATRLEMKFTRKYKEERSPNIERLHQLNNEFWDKLIEILENEYHKK